MKRHFLFLVMAVLLVGPGQMLHAQLPEVSTLPGLQPPQSSITRQYKDKMAIHYYDDGSKHYFVLQDPGNPNQAILADFFPYLEIHDFEIYQDILYFCGKFPNGGNPYGIVGFVKIDDLFYNNGIYNISIVNSLYLWGSSTNTPMTSCDKMDLFEDSYGYVHLAIVGELSHGSYYYSNLRRTYADIWYDGYAWKGNVMYHKDDLYKPTDITCTDNAVVITAYDEYRKGAVILVYKKYEQFPNYPVYPHVIKIDDPMLITDNVLVERLKKDDVVVANHYQDPSTGEYGTALHFIENVMYLPNSGNFPCYHIKHDMPYGPQIDMRYNKKNDRVFLVQNSDYPQLGLPLYTPTFFSFSGYNNIPYMTLEAWFRPDLDIKFIKSIDNRQDAHLLSLSGAFGTAEPLMGIKGFHDYGCYDYFKDIYMPSSSYFYPSNRDVPCMDFYNSNIVMPVNSLTLPVNIHCGIPFASTTEVEETELSMTGLNDAGETLLGINDDKAVDFAISPNPAKDIVTLKCTESIHGTIEIIDIQGKSWCKKAIEGNLTEINVSTLPAGTYLMRLTTPDGTTTKKLNIE